MLHLHILISGMVTGVGFRYFVVGNARKIGVTGWVRNTDDEKVEAVLEGEKEKVEQMLELCKEGPAGAWAKKVKILERKEIKKVRERFQILF